MNLKENGEKDEQTGKEELKIFNNFQKADLSYFKGEKWVK